ncbi:hypothetical protein [Leptolyngbya iicbica]|uniref:Uncharacterized protein n=2 Tax=Cyanophyceae TaxID=3028117 RepID=A0A4Q7E5R6_9CYAN|nr:hypothetical protein [Leptolyngbya sp. LK]RZM77787.1 hypothetical protein DYY88_14525 [Leptolyngbya sp. LK]
MSAKQPSSQSIRFENSQVSNLQLGGVAGRDLNVTQYQEVGNDHSGDEVTSEQVLTSLKEIGEIIGSSTLSEELKSKAIRNIETAQDEVSSQKPDKEFAVKNLQKMTQVLQSAEGTVEAGTSLWEKVVPLLKNALPWFGVAAARIFL